MTALDRSCTSHIKITYTC